MVNVTLRVNTPNDVSRETSDKQLEASSRHKQQQQREQHEAEKQWS